jgi:hypothetical protein
MALSAQASLVIYKKYNYEHIACHGWQQSTKLIPLYASGFLQV